MSQLIEQTIANCSGCHVCLGQKMETEFTFCFTVQYREYFSCQVISYLYISRKPYFIFIFVCVLLLLSTLKLLFLKCGYMKKKMLISAACSRQRCSVIFSPDSNNVRVRWSETMLASNVFNLIKNILHTHLEESLIDLE